jgi:predicted acylesterase/phospholipase RssA/CRP-like cAMP-binding protein
MNLDPQRVRIDLQHLDWARQLDEEIVHDIADAAEAKRFEPGQTVIELGSEIETVYFVVAGRMEGSLFDRLGKKIRSDTFQRGSAVGLFSQMLPDRSYLQVTAVEQTTVICLALDELLQLTAKHREFQIAMFRIAANIVKRLVMVDRDLPKPAAVAVVHHSDTSRPLVIELAKRLRQLGELPCIAGDEERWLPQDETPHRLLFENSVSIGPERIKQLLKDWTSHNRIFIDFHVDHSAEDLHRMLGYADTIFWCLRPQDADTAVQALKGLQEVAPRIHEKICLVWFLTADAPAPPYVPQLAELAARDFKTYSGDLKPNQGELMKQGIERIVHYLRGVRIGLALGGGAARGMAHLGVLKALEQNGIFVDMLAGTSAGAMVGTIYASGMNPEYSTKCFKTDLLPPWLFRQLPGSGYWYLLYKYRFNQFDSMLRTYLDHLRVEQLVIPVTTIGVDLVDGVPLLRDTGDATHNILESINLPPLALPIVSTEQAVVDGGLLNNVPANTLFAKGCNFVIASTVTAQLEKDFMGIRSKKSRGLSTWIASIQVIMRQNMIQSYSMNAVGVEPADFVIAPNVTSFDISEFTRADEMAVIGERTTQDTIAPLKAMLAKLDPQLFCQHG